MGCMMHTYFMRAAALLIQDQWSISTDNNLGDQPHNLHACKYMYIVNSYALMHCTQTLVIAFTVDTCMTLQ